MNKVLLFLPKSNRKDFLFRYEEMNDLLHSLNLDYELLDTNIRTINPSTYFSKQKIEQIKETIIKGKLENINFTALVLDVNLSGTQVANLKDELEIEIIDKTMLILSIFESHAYSYEAKLQVEIAKLQYKATQLVHTDADYAQVTSGSGKNKGSGEKEKELEKRRIRRAIFVKKQELEQIKKARKTARIKRKSHAIPVIAIVGYTNAGKSSLINLLLKYSKTNKEKYVLAENRLFATLETSTRLIDVYNYPSFLITDTVGFLKDLPHFLISAFKSTLEEIKEADLLIEVVDISSSDFNKKMKTTSDLLSELGCDKIKKLTFYNKSDISLNSFSRLLRKDELFTTCVGEEANPEDIISFICDWISKKWKKHTFFFPYGENYFEFYKHAYILKTIEKENGLEFIARIDPIYFDKYSIYLKIKDS